jgi:phosphate transport system substrate-binding protein
MFGIYSGKIKSWRELGGYGEIYIYCEPYCNLWLVAREEEKLGKLEYVAKFELRIFHIFGYSTSKNYEYTNYRQALGHFYMHDVSLTPKELKKLRFLKVDGAAPTAENVANGTYPFFRNIYAVIVKHECAADEIRARMENAQKLIDWILSEQGQKLVEKCGFARVKGVLRKYEG